MGPLDLDYTLTFKLTDDGVRKIDELTKEQLEEAKRLIDKALEDYEKPKKYWFVSDTGEIRYEPDVCDNADEFSKEIGNYFRTEEEAEKAVKKLKALKRLKNNNLRFSRGYITFVNTDEVFTTMNVRVKVDTYSGVDADLDLLFGDEDE